MRNYGPKFIVTFSVIGNTVCHVMAKGLFGQHFFPAPVFLIFSSGLLLRMINFKKDIVMRKRGIRFFVAHDLPLNAHSRT